MDFIEFEAQCDSDNTWISVSACQFGVSIKQTLNIQYMSEEEPSSSNEDEAGSVKFREKVRPINEWTVLSLLRVEVGI